MYNQLLYFIVALLLFTLPLPANGAPRPPLPPAVMGAAVFGAYALVCRISLRRLQRQAELAYTPSSTSQRFHKLQARLSILALCALAIYVYALNIKLFLSWLPGFDSSNTLAGLIGLLIYFAHLLPMWIWSHPIHRAIHGAAISRSDYVRGNAGFQAALLAPWLLISIMADILERVPLPGYLETEPGQMLLLGVGLVFFLLFSPWLMVRLWRCESLPDGPVRTELEKFCERWDFSVGDFLLWPLFGGEMLTAAVMGLLPRVRYILVTKGLLRLLDFEELKAVAAHEMGHVRRLHLPFYLLLFMMFPVMAYATDDTLFLATLRWDRLADWVFSAELAHPGFLSVLYTLPVIALMLIYFRYIFGFFMRNSERQADIYALVLVGHPFTLISSLEKIAFYSGRIENLPSWHHFSISERIRFLLDCYNNPAGIRRHHLKLYGSAVALLAVASLVTGLGLHFKDSQTVGLWRNETNLRVLAGDLPSPKDSAELYAAYGGSLLEKKLYGNAELILRKALEAAPDNAELLNNLAWLYATSPDPYFKPHAALELALKAARLAQGTSYIYDTLAEAYYVNGSYEKALEAINKALDAPSENNEYLLRQKSKFQKALESSTAGAKP